MYVYVYMCVYIYIYMYVCVCIYIYIYILQALKFLDPGIPCYVHSCYMSRVWTRGASSQVASGAPQLQRPPRFGGKQQLQGFTDPRSG